jgi:hypothetical protein
MIPVRIYNEALAFDPVYSRACSGLGWVYANQTSSGHLASEEAHDLAREATWTVLALEPNDARAYANVGWIAMNKVDKWHYHPSELEFFQGARCLPIHWHCSSQSRAGGFLRCIGIRSHDKYP